MTANPEAVRAASDLMLAFADRTGLTAGPPGRRYLWTDAFAVCNFHALARATGQRRHTDLAVGLIEQVHEVLGRHRPGDPSAPRLGGLGSRDGAEHPTAGGLRIGKPLPERRPDEPFDDRLEWERDGQYFHYLTKWMHALDQTARVMRDGRFNVWARELAEVAHRAFTTDGGRRMVWKMSTDLSRPLVTSMGQHDPLDGFITCVELQATAAELGAAAPGPSLSAQAADFATMLEEQRLSTGDPLGIGGLLVDAGRVHQLLAHEAFADGVLFDRLLASALTGLAHYVDAGDLQAPASRRLAFRELGLAIGLQALRRIRERGPLAGTRTRVLFGALEDYAVVGDRIEAFWREPAPRATAAWAEHHDINEVMLATRLVPDGFLGLPPLA